MNFTNLDQSYILEELGVDFETADCYLLWNINTTELHIIPGGKTYKEVEESHSLCRPCWSVYALMKLLPPSFKAWDDDAGRTGANVEYHLNIVPGSHISYSDAYSNVIVSRPLTDNPIAEIILIISTVQNILKPL